MRVKGHTRGVPGPTKAAVTFAVIPFRATALMSGVMIGLRAALILMSTGSRVMAVSAAAAHAHCV